jgi:hypothetical protein
MKTAQPFPAIDNFTNGSVLFFLWVMLSFTACARYQKIPTFDESRIPPAPDYRLLENWAAHPEKVDSSDRDPGVKEKILDEGAEVDVFFIHPTTFTRQRRIKSCNGDLRDAELNAKTDRTTILFQASAFRNGTRVFAPRYRQAHFNSYFTKDKKTARKAFDIAYEDVVAAFEYYMSEYNQGRPFIIAAHSQGSTHGIPLIRQMIDGKGLQEKLVAAYLIGLPVQKDTFRFIKPCRSPEETGCFISWRTFKEGAELENEKNLPILVTNPISWNLDTVAVPKENNLPSLLRNFDEIHPTLVGAQVHSTVLWVNKPKFKGSIFLRTDNYHPADINFFYFSIRKNVGQRISAYFNHKKQSPSLNNSGSD